MMDLTSFDAFGKGSGIRDRVPSERSRWGTYETRIGGKDVKLQNIWGARDAYIQSLKRQGDADARKRAEADILAKREPYGEFREANPFLHNREDAVARAQAQGQAAIDAATRDAEMKAASMGLDYIPDVADLMGGAALKSGNMTQAGFGVDRENVGIQNEFEMSNARGENSWNQWMYNSLTAEANEAGEEPERRGIGGHWQSKSVAENAARAANKYAGLTYDPVDRKIRDVGGMMSNYLRRRDAAVNRRKVGTAGRGLLR